MPEIFVLLYDQLQSPQILETFRNRAEIVEFINIPEDWSEVNERASKAFPKLKALRNRVNLDENTLQEAFKYAMGLTISSRKTGIVPITNQITYIHVDAHKDMSIDFTFPKLEKLSLSSYPNNPMKIHFHDLNAIENLKRLTINNPNMTFGDSFYKTLEKNKVMEECVLASSENIPQSTLDIMSTNCPKLLFVRLLCQ